MQSVPENEGFFQKIWRVLNTPVSHFLEPTPEHVEAWRKKTPEEKIRHIEWVEFCHKQWRSEVLWGDSAFSSTKD